MRTFICSVAGAAFIYGLGAGVASAAGCTPAPQNIDYEPLKLLDYAYWNKAQLWADAAKRNKYPAPNAKEVDLLARVSVAQRDYRWRHQCDYPYHLLYRRIVADLDRLTARGRGSARDAEYDVYFDRGDAARALDALVAEARTDFPGTLFINNTFRTFQDQLRDWPVNLAKYFNQNRAALAPHLRADRSYDEGATGVLRVIVGKKYAFPGFSLHQAGNAVDFHAVIDNSELTANTGDANKHAWCISPAFTWLRAHARGHHFVLESQIDEPWHWKYLADVSGGDPNFLPSSCSTPPKPKPKKG